MADTRGKDWGKRKGNWKKSTYSGGKKRQFDELKSGLKGFIVTCDGLEHKGVSEAYNILNQFADQFYGPENATLDKNGSNQDNDNNDDIENELKNELEEIKSFKTKERRFQSVRTGVHHCLFIKTTLEDPSDFVYRMLTEIQDKQLKVSRFCMKILPVEQTCFASIDTILTTSKVILAPHFFKDDNKPATFCVQYKHRCNNVVKRDDLLPKVAQLILDSDKGHTVSFDNPDYLINIDVIKNICTIAIIRGFYLLRKYNIQSLVEDVKETRSDDEEKESNENKEKAEAEVVEPNILISEGNKDSTREAEKT